MNISTKVEHCSENQYKCYVDKGGKRIYLTPPCETRELALKCLQDRYEKEKQPCRISVAGDYLVKEQNAWTIQLDGKDLNFISEIELKVNARGENTAKVTFIEPLNVLVTGAQVCVSETDIENFADILRHYGYLVEKVV